MTRQKPTKLRPAEGGRYHEPVGPSPEVVAMIRAHDDATEKRRAMIEATAKAIVEARAANAATDAASSLKVGDALDRSMFKPDTPGFVLQPSAVGTVGGQEFKVGDRVRSRDHRAWSDARGLRVSAVTERNVVCVDAHGAHCFTWFPWELEHVAAEPAKPLTLRDLAPGTRFKFTGTKWALVERVRTVGGWTYDGHEAEHAEKYMDEPVEVLP